MLKTLVTVIAIPLVLVASYLGSYIAVGERLDLAVVTVAVAGAILAPSLFALWTGAGWRAAAEGVGLGLGLAVIGSAIGIATATPFFISAGGLVGVVLAIRWSRRYRPTTP